jgi:NAD(P)-dependent dehydrogenase (short-subunit alcohol dehydrogenase family)
MGGEIAVIVGAGSGLSASLARACARRGMKVALAARDPGKLAPQGIHVGHFVIDGGIHPPGESRPSRGPDGFLDPDAIARTRLHVHDPPRSAWTREIELRPWTGTF